MSRNNETVTPEELRFPFTFPMHLLILWVPSQAAERAPGPGEAL